MSEENERALHERQAAAQERREVKQAREDGRRKNILGWLSTREENIRHKMISESRVPGTGTWFTDSEIFRDWKKGSSLILLCPGHGTFPSRIRLADLIEGAGKTFITFCL